MLSKGKSRKEMVNYWLNLGKKGMLALRLFLVGLTVVVDLGVIL